MTNQKIPWFPPQNCQSLVNSLEHNSTARAELNCESMYALQHSPSRNSFASGGCFVRLLLSSIHAGAIVFLTLCVVSHLQLSVQFSVVEFVRMILYCESGN